MRNEAEEIAPPNWIGGFFERDRRRAIFPGVLGWAVTLMPTVVSPARPVVAKGLALASLAALLLGIAVVGKKRTISDLLLMWGFPILAAGAWCVVGARSGSPDRVTCVVGGMAWGMFALAAISPRASRSGSDVPPHEMATRGGYVHRYVAYGITFVACAMVLSLGGGFLAKERNTLRFVVGVVSSLAVLSAADRVFEDLHAVRKAASPRSRRRRVAMVGILMVLVMGAGAIVQLLQR